MTRAFMTFFVVFGLGGLSLVAVPSAFFARDVHRWNTGLRVPARFLGYVPGSSPQGREYGFELNKKQWKVIAHWREDEDLAVGSQHLLVIDPGDPSSLPEPPGFRSEYVIPFGIGAGLLGFALLSLLAATGHAEKASSIEGPRHLHVAATFAIPRALKPVAWLLSPEPPFGQVTGAALFFSFCAAAGAVITRFEVAGNPIDARLFGWGWVDPREPRDWHWAGALLLLALALRSWTTWQKHQAAAKGGTLGPGR